MRIAGGLLFSFALLASAQTPSKPAPDLKFEVASLKPSPPETRGGAIKPSAGGERYEANGVPLKLMIQVAYRVKADQVAGGPGWMDTELFDMNAKAEKPSTVDELHVMLQNLLAERFQLQFHRATKELPMYALTVDKGGPKLDPHEAKSAGDPWIDQAQAKFLHMNLIGTSAPMDYLAWRLSMLLDLPVVDQTHLKGGYDFKLSYTAELPPNISPEARINGDAIDTSGATIFEAIRQQLGLKLEKARGPVEILQIDHVEKLSGN
jgi:uncharacterized protein (TIGR03435 family)